MDQNQTPIASSPIEQMPAVPSKKKFWTTDKIVIGLLLIICITLFIIAVLLTYLYLTSKKAVPVMNDALSNQPLYDFTGTIEKISGSVLTVSKKTFIYEADLVNGETSIRNEERKTTYLVTISDKTTIISELPLVPYTLKLATTSAFVAESSLNNLKVGQTVQVISNENLRSLPSNSFVANSVTISAGLTSIMGKVENIESNNLLVKTAPPSYPEEKIFQIEISSDTEIVASNIMTDSSDTKEKKLQLPVSVLKKGTTVLVYTDADINQSDKLRALKIEIIKDF
jgi:hypothetical protein